MTSGRPTKTQYFMGMAFQAAKRSSCQRRAVGAVLVKGDRVVSTGYNGSPPGLSHCLDDGCLMFNGNCIRTVHAEMNALLHSQERGDKMYCTDMPCLDCLKAIMAYGVRTIYYCRPYPSASRELFTETYKGEIEFRRVEATPEWDTNVPSESVSQGSDKLPSGSGAVDVPATQSLLRQIQNSRELPSEERFTVKFKMPDTGIF